MAFLGTDRSADQQRLPSRPRRPNQNRHPCEDRRAVSRILYLCYDGLCDQIGQSQVLPYLAGCAARGHRITAITFEKPGAMAKLGDDVRRQCHTVGIDWKPQTFHRYPPLLSKLWDMHRLRAAAIATTNGGEFDLVHGRSYQGSYVALQLKQGNGLKMLFDMRGFWADQRREGGRWRDASLIGRFLYRQWKAREAQMIGNADHILVLTGAARDEIMRWPSYQTAPVSVIPCCTDFEFFHAASPGERAAAKTSLGIDPDAPVLGYLGSVGTVYRFDAHLRLFDCIRRRDARAKMVILGAVSDQQIMEQASAMGISLAANQFVQRQVPRDSIAHLLAAADVATGFCIETMSSKGVSLTKLGEYLACGVPMIGNDAVGDTGAILHELCAGLSIADLSDSSLEQAADAFFRLKDIDREALRERARSMFDLPLAIKGYGLIYDALTPLYLPPER